MQSTLNNIADHIEEHGWCKFESVNTQGGCCLNWAWACVTDRYISSDKDKIYNEIVRKIQITHPNINGLIRYNDRPTTTKEDVLRMLRS